MNPVICAGVFNTLITKPFSWLLRVLYEFCGNYGVAIILFTVVVKLIMLYFGMKSKQTTMKTSRLQPKLKALEAKYPNDKTKYQMEMSKLYKEEGINPMAGCLWSLIPFPFLIGLYGVLRKPLTNLMKLTEAQITTITTTLTGLGVAIDTSARNSSYVEVSIAAHIHEFFDQIQAVVPEVMDIDFSFLGMNLSSTPSFMSTLKSIFSGGFAGQSAAEVWAVIGIFLLPICSGLINFLSSWIMQKQNASVISDDNGQHDDAMAQASMSSMKTMLYLMPLMSIYIGYIVPSGLSLYWTVSALLGLIQDVILTKHYRKKYDAEDAIKAAAAAEKAAIEAEKEARRAEQRKLNPDAKNPNTSKRKIKNQQKAAEIEVPEGRLTEEEIEEVKRKKEEAVLKASGKYEPDRPYARGRAYMEDRFAPAAAAQQAVEDAVAEDAEETAE